MRRAVKRVFSMLLVFTLLLTPVDFSAFAAEDDILISGTDGDLDWSIASDGTLTVSGSGDYDDAVWNNYKAYITSAVVDVDSITSLSEMFSGCSNLESVDLSELDASAVKNASYMFYGCESLKSIDLSGLDLSKVVNLGSMFSGCTSLESVDMSGLDLSRVATVICMFYNCKSLVNLNMEGTSFLTNIYCIDRMFAGCSSLKSLDLTCFEFETDSSLEWYDLGESDGTVVVLSGVFEGCDSLESILIPANFPVSENISRRVELPSVDGYVWRNEEGNLCVKAAAYQDSAILYTREAVTYPISGMDGNLSWSISENEVLTISGQGNYDDAIWCYYSSYFTEAVVNVSGITSTAGMFYKCTNLESVDLSGLDTTWVYDMSEMFYGCSSLESLDLSGLYMTNVNNVGYMIFGCECLEELIVPANCPVIEITDDDSGKYVWKDESGNSVSSTESGQDSAKTYTLYRQISEETISHSIKNWASYYTYTGSEVTFEMTVTWCNSEVLEEGVDYEVVYTDNVNAGWCMVRIVGIGRYLGSYEFGEFEIVPAEQDLAVSISSSSIEVGGTARITSSGVGSISYASDDTGIATVNGNGVVTGVAPGTTTIYVYASGDSNHYEAEEEIKVTVSAIDISDMALTLQNVVYNGSAQNCVPDEIVYGNLTLKKGTDYTVEYYNNVNAGTAQVTITGIGNYSGTITKTFSITKASQNVTASIASTSIEAGKTTKVTASGLGTLTYSSSNTSVATVSSSGVVTGVGAGTATITVTAAGNSNYNSASKTVTVTVGLSATTISSVKQSKTAVTVKWSKVTGAKGYYVYRSTSSSSGYSLAGTVTDGNTVSYKDTASKSNGKTYYYKVVAYSGSTVSADSSVKSIKYMKAAVSSLTNTSKGITVKWKKVSGATGYYIYRKTSSGSYKKVKTITKGSTVSWTDTSVKSKNGTTYTYYVQPYNSTSKGAYSTKKTVRLTGTKLSSVTNRAATKITVKWTKKSKITGYQIQYSTSKSFASGNKTVTVTKASTTSKVISSLKKGKTYYVRIRTYKKVSGKKYYSAWSSQKTIKTPSFSSNSATYTYVINTSTKKFHYSSCSTIDKMASSNKAYYTGTKDELTELGYSSCGRCNP